MVFAVSAVFYTHSLLHSLNTFFDVGFFFAFYVRFLKIFIELVRILMRHILLLRFSRQLGV